MRGYIFFTYLGLCSLVFAAPGNDAMKTEQNPSVFGRLMKIFKSKIPSAKEIEQRENELIEETYNSMTSNYKVDQKPENDKKTQENAWQHLKFSENTRDFLTFEEYKKFHLGTDFFDAYTRYLKAINEKIKNFLGAKKIIDDKKEEIIKFNKDYIKTTVQKDRAKRAREFLINDTWSTMKDACGKLGNPGECFRFSRSGDSEEKQIINYQLIPPADYQKHHERYSFEGTPQAGYVAYLGGVNDKIRDFSKIEGANTSPEKAIDIKLAIGLNEKYIEKIKENPWPLKAELEDKDKTTETKKR